MGTTSGSEDSYHLSEDTEAEELGLTPGAATSSKNIRRKSGTSEEKTLRAISLEPHSPKRLASSSYTPQTRRRSSSPLLQDGPLKRRRCTFNNDYLNLFNEDIADVAVGLAALPTAPTLHSSQIGAVSWSALEKELFFSALGRLGRDDLPGIAARIGSKSPLEVQQYIMLLSEQERQRHTDSELRKFVLKPVNTPAAIEIGEECCRALEITADDMSLRQENHEVTLEKTRWGENRWLLTQAMAETLTDEGDEEQIDEDMPFADLFHLRNWLSLSQRIFMNSVLPDYNWQSFSDEPPSIRSTALMDYYSLVTGITRRIIVSTIYMAESRIAAGGTRQRALKRTIRARDVRAAMETLSMKTNIRDFWPCVARRLRLDVMPAREIGSEELYKCEEEQTDEDRDRDKNQEVAEDASMLFDEVEAVLGKSKPEGRRTHGRETTPRSSSDIENQDLDSISSMSSDDNSSISHDADGSSQLEADSRFRSQSQSRPRDRSRSFKEVAIQRDIKDAIFFSTWYEGTTRARETLQLRIETEHTMEEEADTADVQATTQEEMKLWRVLRKEEVIPVETRKEEKGERKSNGVYAPATVDWRENLDFVSNWEGTR